MNEAPPPTPPTRADTGAAQPGRPQAAAAHGGEPHSPQRVRHLFRGMTRLGLVHPLQHLLQRYRSGERG